MSALVIFRTVAIGVFSALALVAPVHAASWFVAPNGDDAAAGTLEKPFATVARAQHAVEPGDTVFLRGGVYQLAVEQIAERKDIFGRVIVLEKSGTSERPITYRAYEKETPTFDFSAVKLTDFRVTAFYVKGSWLRLVGLDVRGVQVAMKEPSQSICFESQGSHNVFERLTMHDGQAIGIYHVRGAHNLFLNCDAWNNWDYTSEDGRGENVDGFGCHPTRGSVGNTFRGCRAWLNSDDGYDCIGASEVVTFENCWAFRNGFSSDGRKLANGNGFKIGGYGSRPLNKLPRPIPRHVTRFCVAVGNKDKGFYANHHIGGCDWINNSAFRNGANFHMQGRLADNVTEVDGYGHKLVDNLSYPTTKKIARVDFAKCELAGNSFTLDLALTDQDFVGLDESELTRPRDADGSLPKIDFLRPAAGSWLIRAGTGVGDDGKPATIGAFSP